MATKATLINSSGKKVVVDSGSAEANKYFSEGYQLMGSSGKYVANNSNVNSNQASSLPVATIKPTTVKTSTNTLAAYDSNGNTVYVQPGTYNPGISATKPDLNSELNSDQDQNMSEYTSNNDGTPGTSKATKAIEAIKSEITPTDVTKPDTLNLEKTYSDLYTKYGLEDLETNLNDLQNQEQELLSTQRDRQDYAETGDTSQVALGVIGGRQSEIDRQTSKQLTEIRRQQSYISNQIKTKYDMISNIMNLKQTDYANALAEYQNAYSNNLTILNMVNSQETTELNNARSDYSTMISALTSNDIAIDTLNDAQKTLLTKLEVQAGLPTGTYESLLKSTAGSKVTSLGVDNNSSGGRSAYFLSVDNKTNTPKIISMELPGAISTKTSGSGSNSTDEDKQIQNFRDDASSYIIKLDDGQMTWSAAWDALHAKYPEASNELIDQTLGGGYDESKGGWWGRAINKRK